MNWKPFLVVLALVLSLPTEAAFAQKLLDKTKAANDPANDPYTRGGDPAILEAAGYVSTGGFGFGPDDDTSKDAGDFLAYLDLRWIETKHFEIGIALPRVKVTQAERDKIRGELTELQEFMPDIDPRTRVLDPWLRLHLYAKRLEAHYADVQKFLGVSEADFADLQPLWDTTGKYMGIGPYMGQMGKFEILLLPSEGALKDYLKSKLGLTTKLTQRWNFAENDSLSLIVHTDQGKLRTDEALHGHVVFNTTQMFLNAYKHYSYDMPVWVREGCAHWFERRVNPRFNTFDSAEGSAAEKTSKVDWKGPTVKLIRSGKMPSFPTLIGRKTFAELELEDHFATWSIIDYLTTVHPEFLPLYFDKLSGLKDEKFIDDASDLPNVQRKVFKEDLGMSYSQFEQAWKAWVEENY